MLKRNVLLIIIFCSLLSQLFSSQEKQKNEDQQKINLLLNETTDSDYLLAIEKVGEILQSAYINAEFTTDVYLLFGDTDNTSKNLDIILRSIKAANLNVRNQQMYYTILQQLKIKLDDQSKLINKQDSIQSKIQDQITSLGKDKTIIAFAKDTLRQRQFTKELIALGEHYKKTSRLLSENAKLLNEKKRKILDNKTAVFNALQTVEERLHKSEFNLIRKEYPLLWKTETSVVKNDLPANFTEKIKIEKEVTLYYLNHITGKLIVVSLVMLFLLLYINANLRYLRKTGYINNLEKLSFNFLNQGAFVPVLVLGLHIVILYNLSAPAVFTTLLHLVLLVSVCFLFRKNWQKASMGNWLFLIALFSVFSFINLFIPVSFLERCILILINAGAVYYIIKQLKNADNNLFKLSFFRWAGFFFICFCMLSIIFNIFGRVSLSHTLSLSATVALTYVIALSVLLKIIIEIILLQIYRIRVQRGITTIFDHKSLSDNLKAPFIIITGYMWFVVTASSLNTWSGIQSAITNLLSHPISIGNFTFTMGSVILFFALIWMAHLLQKYVAYFFGEIEEEDEENINKRQHSRLLIIRLILLIGGYMLAILASGIPLDKLSIIIGALGVGVGLGLQGIVSNFVSGIILIFDRAIQIGDIIELNSQKGRVKSMDLRTTKINAPNGSEIIIPNGSLLSQNITNWTYTDNLKQIEISFSLKGNATPEDINQIIHKAIANVPLAEHSRSCQIYYNTLSKDNFGILIKFWCSIYRTEEVISDTKQNLFTYFETNNIEIMI
ncbi:mechanosensitive ion channel family protein [Elizabethkingia ursingii]|uniref:Mechanosensitive ion channel protein MscS n=1 Tax=Elizabethkingia ursingii TaxID=1756150 RepID=A0AAJ3NAE0_9FLAO|nr:mechanosensitive ion channel domain-containing protein [Elizabethkingia ursingii]AQX08153.1 mechanosensitive ion channel protein MscS [Elizabethkingia ursingii]OPB73491.1 mechanosensitive ion channel protein MscS [Elizabethkingia ursingii]